MRIPTKKLLTLGGRGQAEAHNQGTRQDNTKQIRKAAFNTCAPRCSGRPAFGEEGTRPYQQRCKAQAASGGGSRRGGCRTGRSALQQGTGTTVQDQGRDTLRTHPHALHQEDIPCAYVYAER